MRSTEMYKIIKSYCANSLKDMGYKRVKDQQLAFIKIADGNSYYVGFQCSQDGFDQFSGSKFTVNIGASKIGDPYNTHLEGDRIGRCFNEIQLAEILHLQNKVIEGLIIPAESYLEIFSDDTRAYVLDKFKPIRVPYKPSDIWFRYHRETDVEDWIIFLFPIIRQILQSYESKYGQFKTVV